MYKKELIVGLKQGWNRKTWIRSVMEESGLTCSAHFLSCLYIDSEVFFVF